MTELCLQEAVFEEGNDCWGHRLEQQRQFYQIVSEHHERILLTEHRNVHQAVSDACIVVVNALVHDGVKSLGKRVIFLVLFQ